MLANTAPHDLASARPRAAAKPRPVFSRLVHWALRSVRCLVSSERSAYVALTPPFLNRQIVLHKRRGAMRTYHVRDETDYCSFEQVFLEEDYRLRRLPRGQELVAYYDRLIAGGRTPLILDCGANIGLSAAYFAEHFPAAKIVGVEPDEPNVMMARRNCQPFDVEFVRAGIAAECRTGRLVDPGLGNDAFRVDADPHGSLDLISIDRVPSRFPEFVPFIVKIDIEGFEADLFSRNTGWVDRFPLLIIELHDWLLPSKRTAQNFLKTIAPLDRDFVYFDENVFSISNRPADFTA
jgi:FkbM family methyltransferase